MKTRISQARLFAAIGALSFLQLGTCFAADAAPASAQAAGSAADSEVGTKPSDTTTTAATATSAVDTTSTSPATTATTATTKSSAATITATPSVADAAPVKLPYGVDDVLKLSHAQISEDVTLTYIQNSTTIYNLSPKDIVYLRNEGVSDRVINAMQDQRRRAAEVAAQVAAQTAALAASQPIYADAGVVTTPTYAQPAVYPQPVYVQEPIYYAPQPIYVQPESCPPASTLYVIPYPAARHAYYSSSHYGYYGGYPAYGGPVVFGSRGHFSHRH